ncbi:hypothetical protein DB31_5978 [Hyalangium minutum]|uniref:Uncharacterized protein n=1 Tax=Hyalangium minutum TaxID=394096 RepID=A0A085VXE4_9BACT|nr:hypothetical protein DB31_5978 [Hyalangium minutum]
MEPGKLDHWAEDPERTLEEVGSVFTRALASDPAQAGSI